MSSIQENYTTDYPLSKLDITICYYWFDVETTGTKFITCVDSR